MSILIADPQRRAMMWSVCLDHDIWHKPWSKM